MKLFNFMETELEFLKKGLALNVPLIRGFDAMQSGCIHCETVCAYGCGANCSDTCGGQGKP